MRHKFNWDEWVKTMVKEYIIELQTKNDFLIAEQEEKLKQLLDQLNQIQTVLDELNRENSKQINIFSPRNLNDTIEGEIYDKNEQILTVQHQIEETKTDIEYCRTKKEEYLLLLNEVDHNSSVKEHQDQNSDTAEQPELIYNKEAYNNEEYISKQEVKTFLQTIYQKNEVCLALMNTGKNRCKSELTDMKKMIKNFAENLEKQKS
jgi:hypothetical protein